MAKTTISALALIAIALLAARPPISPAAAETAPLPLPPIPIAAPAAATSWPRTLTENGATITDEPAGVVHLSDPRLLATHFPALGTAAAAALEAKLRAALPTALQTRAVPLAAVLLSLNQSPVASVAVDNTPPAIFISSRPASLVVFDGPPVLAPIASTGLSFAVNTNWDVFETQETWYLLANGTWLGAPAATGPYHPITHLPPAFDSLPDTANFVDVHKIVPAHAVPSPDLVPTIFVSTTPAEIIVTAGPPHFVPIQGTGLQRVENTASALFFDPALGKFYVLFSGRWFSAPSLDGPWSFASDKLPPDFALIPPASPEGAVLASVPGTVQAQEAVLKAQIPTTATLKRGSVQPSVVYSGPPHFVPIPATSMLYAVNTAAIVLKIGANYYVCQSGAWFIGPTPTGPWMLAASIPPAISTIPPGFPYYNVTYVQVYNATPTTVTYGYTAGYVMGFVSAGVLVYGTLWGCGRSASRNGCAVPVSLHDTGTCSPSPTSPQGQPPQSRVGKRAVNSRATNTGQVNLSSTLPAAPARPPRPPSRRGRLRRRLPGRRPFPPLILPFTAQPEPSHDHP